jgi:hypothetical protein
MSTMMMKLKTKNDEKPSSWCAKCQSNFLTLPPVLPQEQSAVLLLMERA